MGSDATPHIAARPAFLVGCHRSGTTLARYFLDAHSLIACPPESKFLAGLDALLTYPQALAGLASLGVLPREVLNYCRTFADNVFNGYAHRCNKSRWVDKTPNYYRLLPLIDMMWERTPQFIYMIRHPLDTVSSLERFAAFNVSEPEDPEVAAIIKRHGLTRRAWAIYWSEVYGCINDHQDANRDRYTTLRYEELVQFQDSAIDPVFTFLDVASERVAGRAFTQPHADGFGDPSIKSALGVYETSVGRWRSWRREEVDEIWDIVRPLATLFGYDVDDRPLEQRRHE